MSFNANLLIESNKYLLRLIQNLYPLESSKNRSKKELVFEIGQQGVNLLTANEKSSEAIVFLPKDAFITFELSDEDSEGVFCTNYTMFVDFIQLSLIRGNRNIEMLFSSAHDHIRLRCAETEFDHSISLEMCLPTLTLSESEFSELFQTTDNPQLKIIAGGDRLNALCSLFDSTLEAVSIEYDSNSKSVKFMAESGCHLLQAFLTDGQEDCSLEIHETRLFSALPLLIPYNQIAWVALPSSTRHLSVYFTMNVDQPSDFLKHAIGKKVIVKLNSGFSYIGVLNCLDGFMNIAMEAAEEHFGTRRLNSYKSIFIRGNNVLYINLA